MGLAPVQFRRRDPRPRRTRHVGHVVGQRSGECTYPPCPRRRRPGTHRCTLCHSRSCRHTARSDSRPRPCTARRPAPPDRALVRGGTAGRGRGGRAVSIGGAGGETGVPGGIAGEAERTDAGRGGRARTEPVAESRGRQRVVRAGLRGAADGQAREGAGGCRRADQSALGAADAGAAASGARTMRLPRGDGQAGP